MKKNVRTMVIAILMFMLLTPSFSMATKRDTTTSRMTWEERLEIARTKRQERIDERIKTMEDRIINREEKRTKFLELVGEYTPELLASFEEHFAEHASLHYDIFNTKKAYWDNYFDVYYDELSVLIAEITKKVENGEIDREEARLKIRAFRETKRTDREAIRSQIELDLADDRAAQEARREETSNIFENLREAKANEDEAVIIDSINGLLENLQEHLEFDQTKLDYFKLLLF